MRKLRRMDFTYTASEGRETTLVRMSSGEKKTMSGTGGFQWLPPSHPFLSPKIFLLKAAKLLEIIQMVFVSAAFHSDDFPVDVGKGLPAYNFINEFPSFVEGI